MENNENKLPAHVEEMVENILKSFAGYQGPQAIMIMKDFVALSRGKCDVSSYSVDDVPLKEVQEKHYPHFTQQDFKDLLAGVAKRSPDLKKAIQAAEMEFAEEYKDEILAEIAEEGTPLAGLMRLARKSVEEGLNNQ